MTTSWRFVVVVVVVVSSISRQGTAVYGTIVRCHFQECHTTPMESKAQSKYL
jgi:hypothetical protein